MTGQWFRCFLGIQKKKIQSTETVTNVRNEELGNLSRETWRNRPHYDNTKEPKEVWSGTPRNQFTSEQREYLDKNKIISSRCRV